MDKNEILEELKRLKSESLSKETSVERRNEIFSEMQKYAGTEAFEEFFESQDPDSEIAKIMMEGKKAYQREQKLGVAGQLGLDAFDMIKSIRQRKAANEALANLPDVSSPAGITRDPSLDEARNRNLRIVQDPNSTPIARAQARRALDAYRSEINQARISSGGQASTFASLGALAAEKYRRASGDIASTASEARDDAEENLAGIAGQRFAETRAISDQDMRRYAMQLAERRRAEEAAGALGAQSNRNMRSALSGFSQSIPVATRGMNNVDLSGIGDFAKGAYGKFSGLFKRNRTNSFSNPYDIVPMSQDEMFEMDFNMLNDRLRRRTLS